MTELDFEYSPLIMARQLTEVPLDHHIIMSPWFIGPSVPVNHQPSTNQHEILPCEPPNNAKQRDIEAHPECMVCDDDGK